MDSSSLPCQGQKSSNCAGWHSVRRILPLTLLPNTDIASAGWINWFTWGSYFEYFTRQVVSPDCTVVYFIWKVDPRTKDKSLSDSASLLLFLVRYCAQSRTHAIQPALLCWHSQSHSFFHSCQGSAHFMHSFWALDPHIPPGGRSRHLNKRKQGLCPPEDQDYGPCTC